MTLYHWSQTAANNGTADITCPFPTGMAPSAVDAGARGMMAAVAKFRDDISGQIATAGTSSAYTVSSFQGFDSLADMHGKEIWFTPHTTNTAGSPDVTLNCDFLGAKPLRLAPGVALPSGVVVQGTPYGAIYNNTDGAWYLKSFYGASPYLIPIGCMLPCVSTTLPNSSFALPYGQAISRTTYAALFALAGTEFGTGDGSTTFNLPDLRGRVPAALDTMGGSASGRLTSGGSGVDGTTIGATGGAQNLTIAQNQLPNVAPTIDASTAVWNTLSYTASNSQIGNLSAFSYVGGAGILNGGGGGATNINSRPGLVGGSINAGSINGGVAQQAMNNMPPAIVVPYLMRII